MKWEYAFSRSTMPEDWVAELNARGAQGWEAIGLTGIGGRTYAFFKRPVAEGAAGGERKEAELPGTDMDRILAADHMVREQDGSIKLTKREYDTIIAEARHRVECSDARLAAAFEKYKASTTPSPKPQAPSPAEGPHPTPAGVALRNMLHGMRSVHFGTVTLSDKDIDILVNLVDREFATLTNGLHDVAALGKYAASQLPWKVYQAFGQTGSELVAAFDTKQAAEAYVNLSRNPDQYTVKGPVQPKTTSVATMPVPASREDEAAAASRFPMPQSGPRPNGAFEPPVARSKTPKPQASIATMVSAGAGGETRAPKPQTIDAKDLPPALEIVKMQMLLAEMKYAVMDTSAPAASAGIRALFRTKDAAHDWIIVACHGDRSYVVLPVEGLLK